MSDTQYRTVHANVYNPAKSIFKTSKNDKAECQTVECCCDSCPLRDVGQCMVAAFLGDRCVYGKYRVETGPTRRAMKFGAWISERKERYKDVPYLRRPPKKLAFIGDYVYLPYAHMTMCNTVDFVSHSAFLISGTPMLPSASWTIDTVERLIKFRPQSMMGDTITTYQTEEVPLFIQHIRECDADMWAQLIERYPGYDVAPDYVGRKAILETLTPDITWTSNRVKWEWDGEHLTSTSEAAYSSLAGSIDASEVEVRIKPKAGQKIEVLDNGWVTSETVFAD